MAHTDSPALRILPYRRISAEHAKKMIDEDPQLTIVDVRREEEFQEGHIRGALLLPNEIIQTHSFFPSLPDKEATLLVYCRSGMRSLFAAKRLIELGYAFVYDFGGIISWPYEIVH
ncbi:MAG: rhodanese-like domain-containing protein [Sphaerochaetaceae bacterium]